jgi:hypothetical protein
MTREQRRWHLWLWMILTPLLAVALILALASRPAFEDQPSDESVRAAWEVIP